jgi:hypothetical protein
MNIELDAAASLELNEAADRYAEQHKGLEMEFLQAVEAAAKEISLYPFAWPETRYGARKFLLGRFPYAIIYLADQDTITIAYTSRKPGYWHYRLKH